MTRKTAIPSAPANLAGAVDAAQDTRTGRCLENRDSIGRLYTVDEVAGWLRTSRKSIYTMVERGQIPGVIRLGRRILFDQAVLLEWLDEKRA